MIPGLIDHLWQSTLFAGAASLLVFALRANRAHVRYWIWFAASVKFLVPFSLLADLGSVIGNVLPWQAANPSATTKWVAVWERVGEPVTLQSAIAQVAVAPDSADVPYAVIAAWGLWALGLAVIAGCWLVRWARVRTLRRSAVPLNVPGVNVPVMSVPGLMEPGVFGIFQPVLLLPEGILDSLSAAQLEAILAHELCHVRRRDNLTAAIHMAVQAVFWFHPLVWWLGSRLVDERERACDEEVLRLGNEPRVYAEGILNVCKQYVASPLVCMSGVSGSNLRRRIETIMKNRELPGLSFAKRVALTVGAAAVLALPLAIGVLRPSLQAQTPAGGDAAAQFEVAAIKPASNAAQGGRILAPQISGGPNTADPGQIIYQHVQLMTLVARAFGIRGDEIANREALGPPQLAFDIVANVPDGATPGQVPSMEQDLLRERFGLRYHWEPRTLPVYIVRVGKDGPKFKESPPAPPVDPNTPKRPVGGPDDQGFPVVQPWFSGTVARPYPGRIAVTGQRTKVSEILGWFETPLRRRVVDQTGLTGLYDVRVAFEWYNRPVGGPIPDEPIPTAQEAIAALGLTIESGEAPVQMLVIDAINLTPTEN